MRESLRTVAAATLVLACVMAGLAAQQPSEELARKQFQTGLDFLRDQKYTEALRDFQRVIDAYPTSSVADDALLEIARYQLDIARNLDAAQAAISTIQSKYGNSNALPFSFVISGYLALARGRQTADLDRALAEFERVPRMFSSTDAVPEAMLARADTLRLTGKCPEAIEQYAVVTVAYPRSEWAPQANVNASRCLVAAGRAGDAMAGLQLAIRSSMAGGNRARARSLNTVLYRLYIRPPQPPFVLSPTTYGGTTGRLRDIRALAANGPVLTTVTDNSVSVLDLANKGAVLRGGKLENARGAFVDAEGRTVLVSKTAVTRDQDRAMALSIPRTGQTPRPLEDITAAAGLSTGEVIVADADGQVLHRFDRELKAIGAFGKGRADRLAVGSLDQIAVLDRDGKAVSVVTRDGRPLGTIAPKGQGWVLGEPVDIGFDAFDHLYVLDRNPGTVWIFSLSPAPRLLTSFTIAEKLPGSFRRATAMALDGDGRLYIFDERSERIQVYQ